MSGQAVIEYMYDQAVIESMYDQAVIESMYGQAVIKYMYDQAVIKYMYGQAVIESMYGNGIAKVFSNKNIIKKVLQESVIICICCEPQIIKKSNTSSVILKKKAIHTKQSFIEIYEDNLIDDKHIKLYKSVNPDTLCDFYTGRIKYEGIVKPESWNPYENVQCGDGLHLSPLPQQALNYNDGKLLECKVAIKDFVVYPHYITKVRCKKVEVIGDYKE